MNPNDDSPLVHGDHISFKVGKPWMAAIYFRTNDGVWNQMCAGTLISSYAVITGKYLHIFTPFLYQNQGLAHFALT